VQLTRLALQPIRETTEYAARLKSRQSVVLQSLVDGRLTRIYVASGDEVRAGQALMQIDASEQRATMTSARAEQAGRRATLRYSAQQFHRAERLYEGGAISLQELDRARASFYGARADLNAAGAHARANEAHLDRYRIVAPIDGVVGDIAVRLGDHITPTTNLTTIDDNRTLEARISVPIEQAHRLRLGMKVELMTEAGAVPAAEVAFISSKVNEETQSLLVKALVDNRKQSLRAEQLVRAAIVWGQRPAIVIPAAAVQPQGGQSFVFVAEAADGKLRARRRAVVTGELRAEGYVASSGLAAGEQLIVAPVQRMSDGKLVVQAETANGKR